MVEIARGPRRPRQGWIQPPCNEFVQWVLSFFKVRGPASKTVRGPKRGLFSRLPKDFRPSPVPLSLQNNFFSQSGDSYNPPGSVAQWRSFPSPARSWSQCPMRWRSLTTDARCEIRCVDQQRLVWNLTRRVKKKLGWNNCQFCWSTPDRPSPFSETFDRSRVSTISSPLKEKRIKQWESCNEHMQQGRYVIVQDVPTKCETFHFAAVWPIYLGPILLLKFPLSQVGKLPLLLGSKFLTFPSPQNGSDGSAFSWSPCDRDVGIQRPTRCTPGPSLRITACWAARNSSREAPRSFCTSWVPCWKLTCSFRPRYHSARPLWDGTKSTNVGGCRLLYPKVPKVLSFTEHLWLIGFIIAIPEAGMAWYGQ